MDNYKFPDIDTAAEAAVNWWLSLMDGLTITQRDKFSQNLLWSIKKIYERDDICWLQVVDEMPCPLLFGALLYADIDTSILPDATALVIMNLNIVTFGIVPLFRKMIAEMNPHG